MTMSVSSRYPAGRILYSKGATHDWLVTYLLLRNRSTTRSSHGSILTALDRVSSVTRRPWHRCFRLFAQQIIPVPDGYQYHTQWGALAHEHEIDRSNRDGTHCCGPFSSGTQRPDATTSSPSSAHSVFHPSFVRKTPLISCICPCGERGQHGSRTRCWIALLVQTQTTGILCAGRQVHRSDI